MKSIKNLKNGDIVFLKTGAMGIVSNILYNVFGDDEDAYEISFMNNKVAITRSKDFISCIW